MLSLDYIVYYKHKHHFIVAYKHSIIKLSSGGAVMQIVIGAKPQGMLDTIFTPSLQSAECCRAIATAAADSMAEEEKMRRIMTGNLAITQSSPGIAPSI